MPDPNESRPGGRSQAAHTSFGGDRTSLRPTPDYLDDLTALAESLRGRLVVQVEISESKYRTYIYRSADAAERAVRRAQERGQRTVVTLCQLLPVGTVVGLGVAR